jgi:hypothetical protein
MRDKATVFENMEKARRSLPRPFVFDPVRLALGFTLALLALSWVAVAWRHRP